MFSNISRASLSVIIGIALIVMYSIVMIATGGDAVWAWLLLVLGLAAIFDAARHKSPSDG